MHSSSGHSAAYNEHVRRRSFVALLTAAGMSAQTPQVVAIAHRGEHLKHPENTLAAYRAAYDAGADFFETDVRTTLDGKLVIMHDATVNRCTNGSGKMVELTFDEIRKLDAGVRFDATFKDTRVPTFDEVLAFARDKIGVYIDAKQIAARHLVEAVARHDMLPHVVVYGNSALLKEIQQLERRIKVMPEANSVDDATRLVAELNPPVFAFGARDFHDDVIAVAKKAKAGIYVDRLGTADNEASWLDAVQRGATGIQTDHPAELVQFLRSKGWHR